MSCTTTPHGSKAIKLYISCKNYTVDDSDTPFRSSLFATKFHFYVKRIGSSDEACKAVWGGFAPDDGAECEAICKMRMNGGASIPSRPGHADTGWRA